MSNLCKCGRDYRHCRLENCGSRNVYRRKFDSMRLSGQHGCVVEAYTCRTCGETSDSTFCNAPPITETLYSGGSRPDPSRLDPYSNEYMLAGQARFEELLTRKNMTVEKASALMLAEGWKLVRGESVKTVEQSVYEPSVNGETQPSDNQTSQQQPLTLEDIVNSFTTKKGK